MDGEFLLVDWYWVVIYQPGRDLIATSGTIHSRYIGSNASENSSSDLQNASRALVTSGTFATPCSLSIRQTLRPTLLFKTSECVELSIAVARLTSNATYTALRSKSVRSGHSTNCHGSNEYVLATGSPKLPEYSAISRYIDRISFSEIIPPPSPRPTGPRGW